VHVKTLRSQKLTHRKLLQSKAIAIENDLRGTLRNFGLKVGVVGTVRFEARIRELVETIPDLAGGITARRPGAIPSQCLRWASNSGRVRYALKAEGLANRDRFFADVLHRKGRQQPVERWHSATSENLVRTTHRCAG
jgi:hypothetical protein